MGKAAYPPLFAIPYLIFVIWYLAFVIWFNCLVAIVEVSHPFPFRTRKLSLPTPMILPLKGWESRSLPGFFCYYLNIYYIKSVKKTVL